MQCLNSPGPGFELPGCWVSTLEGSKAFLSFMLVLFCVVVFVFVLFLGGGGGEGGYPERVRTKHASCINTSSARQSL